MRQFKFLAATMLAAVVGVMGCSSSKPAAKSSTSVAKPATTTTAPAPAPKPAPAVAPASAPAPAVSGMNTARLYYPTGDAASSALLLEKAVPATLVAGQPFEYTLKVTNISKLTLEGVAITDTVPANMKVDSAAPGTLRDGVLTYNVGNLAPGESKTYTVKAVAAGGTSIGTCATVAYNTTLCLATDVVQPGLKLVKTMPADALVCDVIPVKLDVTNTGTGTLPNVQVTDPLPEGLMTADGQRNVNINVGELAAGQTKSFTFNVKAAKAGAYQNKATASAAYGLSSESAVVATTFRQPVLAITKNCPDNRYIGRPVEYDIVVKNTGNAAAEELVITDTLPAGATFVSASDGGTFAAGTVTWRLPALAAGAEKSVKMVVTGSAPGVLENRVSAQAKCADPVAATCRTTLRGIPALLLEVVDIEDPIEVGKEHVYEITVSNQGSAVATNITMKATLEDTMQFVAATGATNGNLQGAVVTYAPLASLAPKAKATWRLTVKAVKSGDTRLFVQMNADQLDRNVEETESSNFYE